MAKKSDARGGPGALKAERLYKAHNTPRNCETQQSARETDDSYRGAIARLSATRRVVRCRDDLQWILQARDGASAGAARWRGSAYCRTREALLRLCGASSAPVDPTAWHILEALPEHFTSNPTKPAPATHLPASWAVLTPPTKPAPRPAAGLQFVRQVAANTAGIIR